MAVSPGDIYKLAEDLYYGQPISSASEACLRTSAVRAYYAVFHALRQELGRIRGVSDPTDPGQYNLSHQTLVSHLTDFDNGGPVDALGSEVRELQQLRYRADYWINHPVDQRSVGMRLNGAKQILRDLPNPLGRQLGTKRAPQHEAPYSKP